MIFLSIVLRKPYRKCPAELAEGRRIKPAARTKCHFDHNCEVSWGLITSRNNTKVTFRVRLLRGSLVSTKIRMKCTSCERALTVGAEKGGKKLRCPTCDTVITVPSLSDSEEQNASGAARKAKRRKAEDPDDIWSQPLSSYSSPAIEEHEYEQYGIPAKKPRLSDVEISSDEMTLKGPMIFFVIGLVIGIVSIVLAMSAPEAGRIVSFGAIGIGALISVVGHWKIRESAYAESTSCGLMFVWLPLYQPYYILSRFSQIKTPFLVTILGNIVAIVGVVGMVMANVQLEKAGGG
jgi:hypothetical protein